MPGIGGREAAARIAAASPGTTVILMTAMPGSATPPEAMDKRRLTPATMAEIWEELATSRRRRAAQGGAR